MDYRFLQNAPDFAAVFTALPDAMAVFAVDPPRFTVLAANDALLALAHRARKDLAGWPLADAFPPRVSGGLAGKRSDKTAGVARSGCADGAAATHGPAALRPAASRRHARRCVWRGLVLAIPRWSRA